MSVKSFCRIHAFAFPTPTKLFESSNQPRDGFPDLIRGEPAGRQPGHDPPDRADLFFFGEITRGKPPKKAPHDLQLRKSFRLHSLTIVYINGVFLS